MGTLVLTDPSNGTTADAALIAANNAAIKNLVNGNLDNGNISPSAAIAYSKLLLTGSIVNADISTGAAILASKIAGYPSDATKALLGDGSWGQTSTGQRKNTAKTVNNTVTETDLLNGEFTVAANSMGTNKVLRFHASGDWLQNAGGSFVPPRFKIKFGSGPTTVIDASTTGTISASGNRFGWYIDFFWQALGATNSQEIRVVGAVTGDAATSANTNFATGTGKYVTGTTQIYGAALMGVNASALDTTSAQALQLTVINGTASASYETKLIGAYYVVE